MIWKSGVKHDVTNDANITPHDNIPPNCCMPKQDGESSSKYSENPNLYYNLAELQEHFQQLQEWLTQLEPTANPHMHSEELTQLTKNYNTSP